MSFGGPEYLRRFQASDPSKACTCGHDYENHHQQFSHCTVVVPNPDYTNDSPPHVTNALMCPCQQYRRATPPAPGSATWLQDIYDATGGTPAQQAAHRHQAAQQQPNQQESDDE